MACNAISFVPNLCVVGQLVPWSEKFLDEVGILVVVSRLFPHIPDSPDPPFLLIQLRPRVRTDYFRSKTY